MQKSHRVVRDEINYCNLSVYEFNGIRFVARTESATELRLEPIEVEEIPQFVTHLRIAVASNFAMNWVDIYVLDKKDIRPLCEMYSSIMNRRIRVLGSARILGEWLPSGELFKTRLLDEFYDNISKEEIEHYRF